jgi:hypothetical protein
LYILNAQILCKPDEHQLFRTGDALLVRSPVSDLGGLRFMYDPTRYDLARGFANFKVEVHHYPCVNATLA